MTEKSTSVQVGEASFDIAGIGDWVASNIWIFLLMAFVAFMFHVFQKGGFAEKLLDYRIKQRELDTKQIDDVRKIIDILDKKFEIDEPWLPFERIDGPDK